MEQESEKEIGQSSVLLTERQLRWSIVLGVLSVLFALAAGYYWGRAQCCAEFIENYQGDAFNDKIAAAIYEQIGEPVPQPEEGASVAGVEQAAPEQAAPEDSLPAASYQAELAGYSSESAARDYATRLIKREVPARVVERTSVGPRRRRQMWYQVVVGPMEYEKLQELVNKIKVQDRLSGVVLVEARS